MEKPTREFKLNISSVRGVETNTSYPFTLNITCKEDWQRRSPTIMWAQNSQTARIPVDG